MTVFHHRILEAIRGYKIMLRKNLPPSKYAAKMRKLGIKRMFIKNATEIKLYKISLKIINELEEKVVAVPGQMESGNFYHGTEEFLQYLKKLLSEFTIEDGKIINASHKSSCALVTAIQLIDQAKEKLTDEIALEINKCSRVIARFGNKEQKEIFNKIISNDQPEFRHMDYFFRQLRNLVSCLDESSSVA